MKKVQELSTIQRKVLGIIVVLVFAVAGVYFLSASRAAGVFISKEAENGTITTPAQLVDDANASSAKAVQFKAGGSPPPPPGPVPPPPPVGDLTDVPYGTDPAQILDVIKPTGGGTGLKPAVIMIHGGGWKDGDKQGLSSGLAVEVANNTPAVAFSLNYRLVPAGTYPKAQDDVLKAMNWIKGNAAFYGVDPTRIALFGMSAGGNLAGTMMDEPGVKLFVGWSSVNDFPLSKTSHFRGAAPNGDFETIVNYLGCTYEVCPNNWRDGSPVYNLNGSIALQLVHSQGEFIPLTQMYSLSDKHKALGGYAETFEVAGDNHASKVADLKLIGAGSNNRTSRQAVLDFIKARLP